MQPAADIIWCGTSAPVMQGIFVGLGVSAVGLIVFPFAFVPVRPLGGKQSNYGRITTYMKWAKRVSWALGAFAVITLAGYVILFTDASGKFCTARFDQHMQLGVYIWTGSTGVTLALLVITGILRGLSRHLSSTTDLLTAMMKRLGLRVRRTAGRCSCGPTEFHGDHENPLPRVGRRFAGVHAGTPMPLGPPGPRGPGVGSRK